MLEAKGNYVRIGEAKDTWNDKVTDEKHERPYTFAELQYLGGTHRVREPYEGGADALRAAFQGITPGAEVVVQVRLSPLGKLELAPGSKPVAAPVAK